jgi:hypothetical protein
VKLLVTCDHAVTPTRKRVRPSFQGKARLAGPTIKAACLSITTERTCEKQQLASDKQVFMPTWAGYFGGRPILLILSALEKGHIHNNVTSV